MNNDLKINMKVLSNNSLNMKLSDSNPIDVDINTTGKEVDPIFRNSPAYTITYNDITSWNDKSNFSGNYNDLYNKPIIPNKTSQLANDSGFINKNVSNLANYTLSTNISEVGLTGNYSDLIDTPTIPTDTSDLTNNAGFITNTVNDLTNYTLTSSLGAVALSNDYGDLNNIPSFATVATSGLYQDLLNKPTLSTVASTGDYDDLINKPSIPTVPTDVSAFNNDAGYITKAVNDLTNYTLSSSLSSVATSGNYNDLSNTPTIPTLDSAVSTSSTNGVQNKVITSYVDDLNKYTNIDSGTDQTYGISYTANARGKVVTITLSVNTLSATINQGSVNYTIFTLPTGFRPSADLNKMVSSNYGHRFKLVIGSDGAVKIGYAYSNLSSGQYDQLAEIITFVI